MLFAHAKSEGSKCSKQYVFIVYIYTLLFLLG